MNRAKQIITLTFLFSAFCVTETNSQTRVPDTLAYLQTVVANKSQYIGRPFSSLLADLQIQVKHFIPIPDIIYDISKETSTSFGFYFPQNADEMHLAYPRLRIKWQTPLDITQSDNIRSTNNNRGQWIAAAASLYSNAIIADIKILE
jgi:hypothetical protein